MDVTTGAITSLVPKLDELSDKHKRQEDIGNKIRRLSIEMIVLRDILLDMACGPRDYLDEKFKLWAEDARQLSYDMELVVDKLLHAPNSEGSKGLINKMGNLFKKGNTSHQIMVAAIEDMISQLHALKKRGRLLGKSVAKTGIDPPRVAPYTSGKDLVGIDGKKDQELLKLLSDVDDVSNKKLKIVSVVGFGGSGKTTVVKSVYDRIDMDFECKTFVPAGQNTTVDKVLTAIISQLTMNNSYNNPSTMGENDLFKKLQEILENKRYLIVIDDIWDEHLWKYIMHCFSYENNCGSRIITTTRIVSVAEACCQSANDSVYQMEPLSDDDSKKLFNDRIFGSGSGFPHEFEQVSCDILKKCQGVPLAIITMASVLAMTPKGEWHVLLKSFGPGHANECWENTQMILSFSYNDLPSYLQTCLLYLITLPGTHVIERYRLVKKWIAEGIVTQNDELIGPSYRNEDRSSHKFSLEEVASTYLDELVNRNVIHPLECNKNGEVISYHIHPMMHNVLKGIAIEEKFAALLDDNDFSRADCMNCRYLFIETPDSDNLIDLSSMAYDGGVHSLTVAGHAKQFVLRHFRGTRVLDLEGCKSIEKADLEWICSMVFLKQLCLAKTHITELPPQIVNLQYLEGLDVGRTQITELPTQIGKLRRLKALDARASQVKEIPDQVVGLTGLVRLLIGDNESCEGVKVPDGIGKMTSLQQLCTIDLRKCSISSLKELGELPYLEEIAVVSGDKPEDTRMNSALLSSLHMSSHLRSLVVYSDFRLSTLPSSSTYNLICRKKLTLVRRSFKVPTGIAEQCFLSMLDIRVCKLEEDDLKILRELPRLQSLIVRLEVLPKEMIHIRCEGFAKLECFCIDCRMPRVTFEEGAMPKLEHLELKLYGGSANEEHMRINHLLNLEKVTLRYYKWYATNKGVQKITEALKTEAKEHQNEITLYIAEENKDGTCPMTNEIFQENRVASSSKMTEIVKEEEEEDTQEGGLHQSSHDIASCSGTSEIEEVVE